MLLVLAYHNLLVDQVSQVQGRSVRVLWDELTALGILRVGFTGYHLLLLLHALDSSVLVG